MIVDELKTADPDFLSDLSRLVQGEHWDPHRILGLHPYFEDQKVIRLWRPEALEIYVELFGEIVPARKIHEAGVFDLVVPKKTSTNDYRVYHQNGLLAHDPYAFLPGIGDVDTHLFGQGVHYRLFEMMGAREIEHLGIQGVRFTVWAPSAMRATLVADFNFWDGRVNPMRSLGRSGIWELFVPGLTVGERYKFEIKTQQGEVIIKADPYALASETRPKTASIVSVTDEYVWTDREWMEKRSATALDPKPMVIYEVHLGSWRSPHGHFLEFKELAIQLADYCNELGFTHVELLPICEHPLDESWGYQVSGFFAVTSRFGSPSEFQFFVDHLHSKGIGVLMDWVPGHFPIDDHSLARFDGTSLYEHEDPRQGYHPHWKTYIFNYGRHEVSNFLIASALFWLDVMHVDGLRVDAVASMLYLDYGREEGKWIPNEYGGKENLDAINFLKHLNSIVHKKYPGAIMIAEESTAFAGVTHSVDWGGLGFDFKWNMGWMNDTLRYFHKDPYFRSYHHNDLTFGLLYAFSERFVLVLSHDEVVHGKGSLLSKMPGDYWQKFANLRLLYSYMMCQPGKKLLFMGGEIGQWNEWHCKEESHWHLLQYPNHRGIQILVKDLNHFYQEHGELWERDFDFNGFEWVDFSDQDNSVISYRRKGEGGELLCVHNFTPTTHSDYVIRLQNLKSIQEIFNSDDPKYGGSGQKNREVECLKGEKGNVIGCRLILAPLATQIFRITFICS
ncbi:MAG: 1,4-alpha-glucan branching protein GlgB [Chlamydiia bacterium]|nr:1,4-alpha-glucan branching protein GlgB [Chlamydiia bacterium]